MSRYRKVQVVKTVPPAAYEDEEAASADGTVETVETTAPEAGH